MRETGRDARGDGRVAGGKLMEWDSGTGRRSAKRRFRFEVAVLVVSALAMAAVYLGKVLPLSASPDPPPDGVAVAWAGQQLQGYTQTTYLDAKSCDGPVDVVLDLYRTRRAPEPRYAQDLRPGKIALTIADDSGLEPDDVRIWTGSYAQMAGNRRSVRHRSTFPAPRRVTALIGRRDSESEQRLLTFLFDWNPVSDPAVNVKFQADWLSSRVPGQSCWLALPGQLSEGAEAMVAANSALGHLGWTRGDRGLPLFNAANVVNLEAFDAEVEVDASASIPAPTGIAPASLWQCGGNHFQASSCQASAVLRMPNGEATRSHDLILWTVVGGLLLSICGGSLIALLRLLAGSR